MLHRLRNHSFFTIFQKLRIVFLTQAIAMLFSHATLRKFINLVISPCNGDMSNAIRSQSQYDLVTDPDAVFDGAIHNFTYPGLPPMRPHFCFATACKMSQFEHKQFWAMQASDGQLPYFSRIIEASLSCFPQLPSQNPSRKPT